MKTPFFGPFDVMHSTNLADNQLINLRPEIVETKDGKNVGALMGTAGLDTLATVGGPMSIGGLHSVARVPYAVTGGSIYTLNPATFAGTLVGSMGGPVNIIDNGSQILFASAAGMLCGPIGVPLTGGTIAVSGYPLTGGTISVGGTGYAIGDVIILSNYDGTQTNPAYVVVTSTAVGVVTGFTVITPGTFPIQPTIFLQASTSGAGVGFALVSPTYGALITGGINYAPGDVIVLEGTSGAQSAGAGLAGGVGTG